MKRISPAFVGIGFCILLSSCAENQSRQNIPDSASENSGTAPQSEPSNNEKSIVRSGPGPTITNPPELIITDRVVARKSQRTDQSAYIFTEAINLSSLVSVPAGATLSDVEWDFAETNVREFRGSEFPDNSRFDDIRNADFIPVLMKPLSTFSSDVDTASYSIVRGYLNRSQIPPANAIRLEEMINYVRYDYPDPTDEHPLAIDTEVTACPWNPDHRLVRIALQAERIEQKNRPAANLVFLVDSSGSMNSPGKLGLLKKSLASLVDALNPDDRISIVTYAGSSKLVLESTAVSHRSEVLSALDSIRSGGSTHGAGGITQAYAVAEENFIEGGVNRVMLCTDGDFNVGVSNDGGLVDLIEEKADSDVFLSVLGFGYGNLNDSMMEKISNHGNGNYSYIDSEKEGLRVLVENAGSTLVTVAKDVKIQIEFNPSRVAGYKLIGYENRALQNHEFNDDQKDAGEVGAGQQVTALYELIPADSAMSTELPETEPLRYQSKGTGENLSSGNQDELLFVKVRYKFPDKDTSNLITQPVIDVGKSLSRISDETLLSASIACFGMLMRNEETTINMTPGIVQDRLGSLDDSHQKNETVAELGQMLDKWQELQEAY